MIAILHAVLDIVFFMAIVWLCTRRLNALEECSKNVEERLSRLEAREQADSREVNYLMERAELPNGR